jgi:hypothetical protein
MPRDIDLPKPSTHLMLLKKLLELFPELVEGGEWDVREGCFRNVLDFLNLPLTHGVNSNEFGRNYRCFRPQRVEVDIFDLLDFPMDEDQVTLLAVLDYCNMSLHDTRRNNFVLSELLLWTKYLQCALQKMYEVAGDLDDEKETLKEDLAVAEAKLASNDTELAEAHEEVSRLQHEQQLLRQEVADLNARAEEIKAAHIDALREADARARDLERAKADSDRSSKAEINRLGRQLARQKSW